MLVIASTTVAACAASSEPEVSLGVIGEVESQAYDQQCGCVGQQHGPDAEENCLGESLYGEEPLDYSCEDRIIQGDSEAMGVLQCQVEAARNLEQCLGGQACEPWFMCSDGTAIRESYVCDGSEDCETGEDEPEGCEPNVVVCDSGETIPGSYRCDGEPDCPGGEDEPADCDYDCVTTYEMQWSACDDFSEAIGELIWNECVE